jgi:hypothetical protein
MKPVLFCPLDWANLCFSSVIFVHDNPVYSLSDSAWEVEMAGSPEVIMVEEQVAMYVVKIFIDSRSSIVPTTDWEPSGLS